MMTPTLLANLRRDPNRCWYCGAHPPTQGHDQACTRPNPSRYITRCPPRPQEARQGRPVEDRPW